MSMDTVKRILDLFPSATSACVSGGGEPLLHPQVFDVLRLVHERRMKTHLVTSGTLLPGCIDDVLDSPVDFLNVSLYGTDRESFAQMTGVGGALFDATISAVAEIMSRRRSGGYPRLVRASFICTKRDLDQAFEFIHLCEDLGVDEAKLKNLTHYGISGYEESMCLHADDPDAQDFVARLRGERFRIPVYLPRLYRADHSPRRCNLPFRELCVDGEGYLAPCPVAYPFPKQANVLEDRDAWNGPMMKRIRRRLLDYERPLPTSCLHCEKMIQERPRAGLTAKRGEVSRRRQQ